MNISCLVISIHFFSINLFIYICYYFFLFNTTCNITPLLEVNKQQVCLLRSGLRTQLGNGASLLPALTLPRYACTHSRHISSLYLVQLLWFLAVVLTLELVGELDVLKITLLYLHCILILFIYFFINI